MRSCNFPGCPELVVRGRCAEHARQVDTGYRGRGDRKLYGSRRWKLLARRVLNEQPWCAAKCGRLATEVDHILSVEDGGSRWDRLNLQPLCHACHSRKTRQDVATRTYT